MPHETAPLLPPSPPSAAPNIPGPCKVEYASTYRHALPPTPYPATIRTQPALCLLTLPPMIVPYVCRSRERSVDQVDVFVDGLDRRVGRAFSLLETLFMPGDATSGEGDGVRRLA